MTSFAQPSTSSQMYRFAVCRLLLFHKVFSVLQDIQYPSCPIQAVPCDGSRQKTMAAS